MAACSSSQQHRNMLMLGCGPPCLTSGHMPPQPRAQLCTLPIIRTQNFANVLNILRKYVDCINTLNLFPKYLLWCQHWETFSVTVLQKAWFIISMVTWAVVLKVIKTIGAKYEILHRLVCPWSRSPAQHPLRCPHVPISPLTFTRRPDLMWFTEGKVWMYVK